MQWPTAVGVIFFRCRSQRCALVPSQPESSTPNQLEPLRHAFVASFLDGIIVAMISSTPLVSNFLCETGTCEYINDSSNCCFWKTMYINYILFPNTINSILLQMYILLITSHYCVSFVFYICAAVELQFCKTKKLNMR